MKMFAQMLTPRHREPLKMAWRSTLAFVWIASLTLAMTVLVSFSAHAADKESAYDRVMRTGVLKVGYTVWPPYQIQDPNTGKISGISAEYVDIIRKILDLKIEWVPLTGLGTQVEGLKRGMYDVVVNDGPYVFTMIKFIDFSEPVFYAPVFAYRRDDDKRFHSLKDLNSPDVRFVGLDGDLSVDLVNRFYPKAKLDTLPASTDPGMMMTNIRTGKEDVAIIDPGSVNTFNKNNKHGLAIISPNTPVAVYPIGFSLMKDDGKLLTLINGAVAAMHNTNTVDPILKKWLPEKGAYYPVAKNYETPK
jgi:ABC-type amino acid transport substrate-binding protein